MSESLGEPLEKVVVGRIGRPHGIRGEVTVEVRTDEPDRRFAPGQVLGVEAPRVRTARTHLTVSAIRWHQGRLLVTFDELADRTEAEAARDWMLLAEVDLAERPSDPEEFYDHQLVGLKVHALVGDSISADVGVVTQVLHSGAQDVLVVRRHDGRDAMVPFVSALVPGVDVAAGRVVVADRPGLLDPDAVD